MKQETSLMRYNTQLRGVLLQRRIYVVVNCPAQDQEQVLGGRDFEGNA